MRTRLPLFASLLLAAACGDDPETQTPGRTTSDVRSNTGDAGVDAAPDVTDTGLAADVAVDDATDPSDVGGDATPVEIGNECVAISYSADEAYRAADIIWVIDTSESMDQEIAAVRSNINTFAESINDSGVDLSVVMVASKEDRTVTKTEVLPFPIPGMPSEIEVPVGYLGVCVPSPLSAVDACPDYDNPPLFMHPDIDVYSTDALERLMVDAYPLFRTALRPRARTHVVVVSDDSSSKDAAWFRDQVATATAPGFSEDWVFHTIGAIGSCGDGSPAVYETLSNDTGGVIQDVCRSDWTPIFDALLSGVINDAEIPCAFGLPVPEDGFVLDPNEVNVFHTPPGGEQELVVNVEGPDDCVDGPGWYYDDPYEPTSLFICRSLCGEGVEGEIDVAFGCDTIKE